MKTRFLLLTFALLSSVVTRAQITEQEIVGYTATAGLSGLAEGEGFDKLVDNNYITKWCTKCNLGATYVEFHSDYPIVPSGYLLATCDDSDFCPGRNPKDWVIKAKLNPTDEWTTIASVTDNDVMQDVPFHFYEFTINNTGEVYQYFRFEVTATQGSDILQLSDFKFKGYYQCTIDLSKLTGDFAVRNGQTLTGTLGGCYKIIIEPYALVTLDGVTINGVDQYEYPWAGITCKGKATIILAEGSVNNVSGFRNDYPGIHVSGSSLTIDGSGTLNVSGNASGIGTVSLEGECGDIVIKGGTINTTGGSNAPGIGCSRGLSTCDEITISGGVINATGGINAPGIGCALERSACGKITISGGVVNATGGMNAPGIGSGSNHSICDDIIISGGVVNATGGINAPGIGCGPDHSACGDVTITNNVTQLTATAGQYAQNSIGAGNDGFCGKITIADYETGNITESPFDTYSYIAHFDANGGLGTMNDKRFMYKIPHSLSDNAFTLTDNAFANWNTKADNSGAAFSNGQDITNLEYTAGDTIVLYAQWQGNELTDYTPYKATQDGSVATASYTKTLGAETVGKYQPWLVPFDYTITADDMSKFSFYKINMIANATKPGEGSSDEMWVFLTRLSVGDILRSNSPYVYKPKQAVTDYKFIAENAILKAKSEEPLAKMETMGDIYSIYAVYANTTPDDAFYFVNNGNLELVRENADIIVPSLQWILRKKSKFGDTTNYAPQIHFYGEDIDGPTGIGEVLQQPNLKQGPTIVNLSGQRLNKMQKGINIVGGKKVVIK